MSKHTTAAEILARAARGDRWAMQAVDGARTIATTYGSDYDAGWPEAARARGYIRDAGSIAAPVTREEAVRLVALVARG